MKKVICLVLAAVLALSLAACGSKDGDNKGGGTALTGKVSTNGSTSMDKVIGALKEQFMLDNAGVTVTYGGAEQTVQLLLTDAKNDPILVKSGERLVWEVTHRPDASSM